MSSRRLGFTLLEVLLALALGAALMAGIFSVMRVHARLAEDGGRRVEEAQLARAVLDLIGREIRNCVPASGTGEARLSQVSAEIPFAEEIMFGGSPGAAATASYLPAELGQFNLAIVGDDTRLILSPHRAAGESAATFGRESGPLVWPPASMGSTTGVEEVPASERGGFVRVGYFMLENPASGESAEQPEASGDAGIERPHGLARLELSQLRREDAFKRVSDAIRRLRKPPQDGEHESELAESTLEGSRVRAEVLAGEVRKVAFRYYDGSFWHWRWDGSAGLPRAVEIELGLGRGKRQAAAAKAPSVAATDENGDEGIARHTQIAAGPDGQELRIYRLTVRVPTAGWAEPTGPAGSVEPQPGGFTPLGSAPLESRQGALP